jgi:hypothetical protein
MGKFISAEGRVRVAFKSTKFLHDKRLEAKDMFIEQYVTDHYRPTKKTWW